MVSKNKKKQADFYYTFKFNRYLIARFTSLSFLIIMCYVIGTPLIFLAYTKILILNLFESKGRISTF